MSETETTYDTNTPIIDKLFHDWVIEEDVTVLYELIAYCFYRDYPIHTAFILTGNGSNGKSSFLRILEKTLGESNVGIIDFHRLETDKFESSAVYHKLACIASETSYEPMKGLKTFKELTGQGKISIQKKYGHPVEYVNYAKIIISANAVPQIEDTSDGAVRRLKIVNFPNQFPNTRDVVSMIPDSEYRALTAKCLFVYLPALLKRGAFTNQPSIEEMRRLYKKASDPMGRYIETHATEDGECEFNTFHSGLKAWCTENGAMLLEKKAIIEQLQLRGYRIYRKHYDTTSNWTLYIDGFRLDDNIRLSSHEKDS